MTQILIIPGLGGSGPDHWQSQWENRHPHCERVRMPDWNIPDRQSWTEALDTAVRACPQPPFLVAHSLGCHVVAHWALSHKNVRGKGALLVAPPDLGDVDRVPAEALVFTPLPLAVLPFPATVLASSNDPYCDIQRAQVFATAWGADFHNLGPWGHLNADSHLGSWDTGWAYVQELLADNTAQDSCDNRA